ncbi:MAG TPA: LysR substrate-binding domain-containing protein [Solirubrobacteraceae bacterium]|nr:LysR substrate-binding domain-containing protein [Solirubrobacteraceae bacterium]
MDARELRYFLILSEELHFGRAAQRLAVAQPVLSKMLRRLEVELGVELFVRDSHSVELTVAGRALLDHARDAIASLDQAVAAVREAGRRELVGTLNVGASPLLRHGLGPAIFERFASVYPGVTVTRREEYSGPLIDELLARRIDVALSFCPARHTQLLYEPFRDAELVVIVSRAHRLAARASVSLPELRDESFLMPSALVAPALREQLEPLFTAAGFAPRYAAQAIDHDEDLAMVSAGHGAMLTSRYSIGDPPPRVSVLCLDPPLELPFELVRHAGRPSPILARFAEVAKQVGQQQQWELNADVSPA